jgi:hypothetical protein
MKRRRTDGSDGRGGGGGGEVAPALAAVTMVAAAIGFKGSVWWSGVSHFEVNMSAQWMTDADMEKWCTWFADYMSGYRQPSMLARVLDFSKNAITGEGINRLLSCFKELGIAILILKFHQNKIDDVSGIAELIRDGAHGQPLRECHLSHHRIGTAAAWEIIEATALAERDDPLWLRLEHNEMDTFAVQDFYDQLETSTRPQKKILSQVDLQIDGRNRCAPGKCRCPGGAPAVHVTWTRGVSAYGCPVGGVRAGSSSSSSSNSVTRS